MVLNLGFKHRAPQGCVLSPILFSVHTNNFSCSSEGTPLFMWYQVYVMCMYAEDMAHMTDTHALSQYQWTVNNLVLTFCENSLELNIPK